MVDKNSKKDFNFLPERERERERETLINTGSAEMTLREEDLS